MVTSPENVYPNPFLLPMLRRMEACCSDEWTARGSVS